MVPLAIDQVLHSVLCWVNSTVASGYCVKLNEMGIWKMNERIKELAEQAGLEGDNGHYEYDWFNPEKFAELIIRECGNYMNSRVPGNLEVSVTVVKMKQHLGVKE